MSRQRSVASSGSDGGARATGSATGSMRAGGVRSGEHLRTLVEARSALAIVHCRYHRALARAQSGAAGEVAVWRAEASRLLGVAVALGRTVRSAHEDVRNGSAVAVRDDPDPCAAAAIPLRYVSIEDSGSRPVGPPDPLALSQSPLWAGILHDVDWRMAGGRRVASPGAPPLEAVSRALARAHSCLVVALESGSNVGDRLSSDLVAAVVDLIGTVVRVWTTFGRGGDARRSWVVEQLRRRLSSHEGAVLAGEVTYRVWPEQAEEPAVRIRRALSCLGRQPAAFEGDLRSLTLAAVDLAALLVRLAANLSASGCAGDAPAHRSTGLDEQLRKLTRDLAVRAEDAERPVAGHADVVAHHLAAGLRVSFSRESRLGPRSTCRAIEPTALDGLRETWLTLATHEYMAVTALDAQVDQPAYDHRDGLPTVIVDAAANVICGAQLLGRPSAFRHRRAWHHQRMGLSYALEAYVAGLRGQAASLVQAQLITLTRLVRAIAAITMIDLAVLREPHAQ